jgi:hypothetical protein
MGIKIAIAVKGPSVIERTVTDIKANPPPEKPDFEIANKRMENETMR